MKPIWKRILITAWIVLTLYLFSKVDKAFFKNETMALRMIEVHVVDAATSNLITNFAVDISPLSTPFRTEHQQHLFIRPEEGRFVLANVGGESLRAHIQAPGFVSVDMDLKSFAFSTEPYSIEMKRNPNNPAHPSTQGSQGDR